MPTPKPTAPKTQAISITPATLARRENTAFENGKKEGDQSGFERCRNEVLEWLEREYMKKDVARDSDKGKAIMELTAGLSKYMKHRK